jgi:hypothetical protein
MDNDKTGHYVGKKNNGRGAGWMTIITEMVPYFALSLHARPGMPAVYPENVMETE